MTAPTPLQARLFLAGFVLFIVSILFSVAGTLLLTAAPQRAAVALGWIYQNVGVTLEQLVMGPTWMYMALMPILTWLLYRPALGARRSFLFFWWAASVGAMFELLGTQTGFPFGAYEYTHLLGPMIADHVPWFIPLSWYAMGLLSYDLARRLGLHWVGTVFAVALFMILWDVALDPAMTAGAHSGWTFWAYEGGGVFFGMPLVNWAGWLLTSTVIAFGFERLLGGLDYEARWAPALWAMNVLFPVFICFAYGAALAGVLGLIALAIPLVLIRTRGGAARPAWQTESS